MRVFPSIPGEPDIGAVFRRFPYTAPPLLEYHDRLLRDPSPLTVAERELIAAYVSGLNGCAFCHGAHRVGAEAYGVDEALFEGLMADLETAAVDPRLKPILAYVRKLTLRARLRRGFPGGLGCDSWGVDLADRDRRPCLAVPAAAPTPAT
jgi:AhpD family alkylhydroperoxidase